MKPVVADLYEKRWIPRQHMIVPIHCHLAGREQSGPGWVSDFSSIGAKIICSLPLSAGDELTLVLPKDGSPEMTIAATVRWNQGQLFGLEFKYRARE